MPTPKLLDQVRTVVRVRHFSLSTERSYVSWIRRFILFHHRKHPKEMAEPEIRQFISHLAVDAKVSASTQPLRSVCSHFSTETCSKSCRDPKPSNYGARASLPACVPQKAFEKGNIVGA